MRRSSFDLIFVSMENWDDVWRRNQFVCAELARRHPEMKLLFVGLARDISNRVRRLKFTDDGDAGPEVWSPPKLKNVFVTRPLKYLPNSIAPCRWVNEAMMRRHVARVAKELGLRNPVLWLNPHHAVHMVGRMQERGSIYDITDDWTALAGQGAGEIERIRRQDRRLCAKADAVIVCSEKLRESKKLLAKNLHLIPNGVDASHYLAVLDDQGPLIDAVANWAKPVLGYTGSIHPERVDLGLVEALSAAFKTGTIALVGPDMLQPADKARMAALKNVVMTGAVPYATLPQYMRGFDVCMTPHRMTPFTESLNPIKLWEYLAAGKPIVSTDVAGFRDYPQHVYLARDAEGFVAGAKKALAEDPSRRQARREEARSNSWESRVDAIEGVIAEVVGKEAGR
jgi:hypothetical protein